MDRGRAIAEAERFAQNAFVAEFEIISRQFQDKLAASRAQLAAKGVLGMVKETARINAERITALLQARLNSLLEGYDLVYAWRNWTSRIARGITNPRAVRSHLWRNTIRVELTVGRRRVCRTGLYAWRNWTSRIARGITNPRAVRSHLVHSDPNRLSKSLLSSSN